MKEESPNLIAKSICPLEGVIRIISKKWALQIVCVIGSGSRLRFSEIQERLKRISPKTLSRRLKELEKAHLIRRQAFPEIPPRVEYALTEDGISLEKAIIPLMDWASNR